MTEETLEYLHPTQAGYYHEEGLMTQNELYEELGLFLDHYASHYESSVNVSAKSSNYHYVNEHQGTEKSNILSDVLAKYKLKYLDC